MLAQCSTCGGTGYIDINGEERRPFPECGARGTR